MSVCLLLVYIISISIFCVSKEFLSVFFVAVFIVSLSIELRRVKTSIATYPNIDLIYIRL